MEEHNWPKVLAALEALKKKTEEEETHAVNFLASLDEVIQGLPDEAFN